MKIRSPWLIRVAAFLGALAVRAWLATLRFRFACRGGSFIPADSRGKQCIYSIWHDSILAGLSQRTKLRVMVSQHADGELITQLVQRLGYEVVRGSSTRGGSEALLTMARAEGDSHLIVTPDGPRGPRRRVKGGVAYLASLTGLSVVPVGVGYSKAWYAGSWDRFAIPRPGSKVFGVFLPAIHIPTGLDREALERFRRLVEEKMAEATQAAEAWARGMNPPEIAPEWKASA
jgi:lysophospholipid acyltransferase (LPLAT)-like uncharacterized protein